MTTKRALIPILALAVYGSTIDRARADSPVALWVAAGAAVVTAGAAVYTVLTSGNKTTTTTTTETKPDGSVKSSTTTTTERRSSSGAGTTSSGSQLVRGEFLSLTDAEAWSNGKDGASVAYQKIDTRADVLKAPQGTSKVEFKRSYLTGFEIERGQATGDVVVPFTFQAQELRLSTADIPGSDGKSSTTLVVTANGVEIYRFAASVRQGRLPVLTGDMPHQSITQHKDLLSIKGLSKALAARLPAGQSRLVVEVTIENEGVGQLL